MNKSTLLICSLIVVAVVAVVAIAVLSAQDGQDDDQTEWDSPVPLSAEMEMKIKQDYLDFRTKVYHPDATVDDVTIDTYYGTYGSCVAVMMTDAFSDYTDAIPIETYETIGGIWIIYNSSNEILIWEDGSFHRLQEAFDSGLLTRDNLREIEFNNPAARHNWWT